MPFRLPVRRFVQGTQSTKPPESRFGVRQWILARGLYRFKTFDLAQVPARSRSQALRLELSQWTPFASSAYYVGWRGASALVWAWDGNRAEQSMAAYAIGPNDIQVLPETVLQTPVGEGLALQRCLEGFEGQHWRLGMLQHSRWWPQLPSVDEWLMFQRDAALSPAEQKNSVPTPRATSLAHAPWIEENSLADVAGARWERPLLALGFLALLVPTLWFGFATLKLQQGIDQLSAEKAQLQLTAQPIIEARSQSRRHLESILALSSIEPYPPPLSLMATVSRALPQDKSFVKDWQFQQGQLQVTISSSADISTTQVVDLLQQAGPFRDVKALPGRDAKSVTFQMGVASATNP